MRLQNIQLLFLLWLVPVLAGIFIYANIRRRQALERFAEVNLLPLLNVSISPARRHLKAGLLLIAFALGVVAAARPAWNKVPEKVEHQGRDLVFILDVSKSMLAEDLQPNRLVRARLAIGDVIDRLAGDRIGLVAFAGNAVVTCPLTMDYGFFRMMLEDVSIDSVSRGGTMIGDAIRKTMDEVFDDTQKQYKDIILITDGEDHDSFPVEAAAAAGKKGIRLLAVGIGDEDQGRRVPITDENGHKTFLQYKGKEVFSRLDGDTLRKMVDATPSGRYLHVATGAIDLGTVYQDLIASAEKKSMESAMVERYEEKFQIFLVPAFLLLALELLMSERRRAGA